MTRQELVNKIAEELIFFSREFNRLSEEKQQKLEEDLRVYYSVIDVEELIAATVHDLDFPFSSYDAPYNIYLKDYVGLDCFLGFGKI